MKKMMMVLMMVFGLSAVFAKPVEFETDDYIVIADDENVQKNFEGLSDVDIVAKIVNAMPKETVGKKAIYSYCRFTEVHEFTEEVDNYFMYSKDGTYMCIVQNLGDGREITIIFSLEPIE